jgi:hypothetical protein
MSNISAHIDVCGVHCAIGAVFSKYFSFSFSYQFHASVIVLIVGAFEVVVPSDCLITHSSLSPPLYYHHCVSNLGFLVILGSVAGHHFALIFVCVCWGGGGGDTGANISSSDPP